MPRSVMLELADRSLTGAGEVWGGDAGRNSAMMLESKKELTHDRHWTDWNRRPAAL